MHRVLGSEGTGQRAARAAFGRHTRSDASRVTPAARGSLRTVPTIRRRLLVALLLAIAAGLVPIGRAGSLLVHSLIGFIVGGLSFAVPLLVHILGHDAPATREKVAGRDGD